MHLNSHINAIRTYGYDYLANDEIAPAYLQALKATFPDLMRVDVGIRQYFVVPNALERLKRCLEADRQRAAVQVASFQQRIDGIDLALSQLARVTAD